MRVRLKVDSSLFLGRGEAVKLKCGRSAQQDNGEVCGGASGEKILSLYSSSASR